MIGVNGLTINNSVDTLLTLYAEGLIDTYECNRRMYLDNRNILSNCNIKCDTFGSLITGNYDLDTIDGRLKFFNEFLETIDFADDIGATKLMFGLARYRQSINETKLKFFKDLIEVSKKRGKILLFEAISSYGNKFLTNHKELIDFSIKNNIKGIHVDYGTLRDCHESFTDISSHFKVLNIHFPYGEYNTADVKNFDISIENYTNQKLTITELSKYLEIIRN